MTDVGWGVKWIKNAAISVEKGSDPFKEMW